jgi:hypothetical protein
MLLYCLIYLGEDYLGCGMSRLRSTLVVTFSLSHKVFLLKSMFLTCALLMTAPLGQKVFLLKKLFNTLVLIASLS